MLYVCATPIGNLRDITLRTIDILTSSDVVLCEDTRVSRQLLIAHGIPYKKLIAFHEHNEAEITEQVITWLRQGLTISQITDAGTPGISDPGARLCAKVLAERLAISSIPGACAYTTLLAVAGLSCPSLFYGFLPHKQNQRSKVLQQWTSVDYAIAIYESPHRIIATLQDIVTILGNTRQIIFGRELTKQFETIRSVTAAEILDFVQSDKNQQRGEFVLLIKPDDPENQQDMVLTPLQIKTLKKLLIELPPRQAVKLTHALVGGDKQVLYNYFLSLG